MRKYRFVHFQSFSAFLLLVISHLLTTTVDAQMKISFAPSPALPPLSLQASRSDISNFAFRLDQDRSAKPNFSPVDTLRMSPWERIWWGRHGLMRVAFKLDEAKPVNDLRQMAKVRRRMLGLHQTLGLVTIASMAVTVTSGFKAANGNGGGLHSASLPITVGLYATTATLALASPPKLVPSRGQWDTIRVHRILAVAHIAGMIVTPMFAPEDENEGDGQSGRNSLKWHRALGVATFATFSTSMLVVILFR